MPSNCLGNLLLLLAVVLLLWVDLGIDLHRDGLAVSSTSSRDALVQLGVQLDLLVEPLVRLGQAVDGLEERLVQLLGRQTATV